MQILYTSDLHGEIRLYQELFTLASSSSAKILALGGDLLPSFPPTKRYEDMVPNQIRFMDEFLLPFFTRMFEITSVELVFLIPGNWDLGYPYLFKKPIDGLIDLNQKSYLLKNGYEFIGYPFVPPTPFRPKDYEKMDDGEARWPPQKNPSYILSSHPSNLLMPIDPFVYLKGRETIEEDLNRLQKPADYNKTIYVMHSPPFKTSLDFIQEGKSAGSRSVKIFIERHQPCLTLHGHIHESPELSGHFFDHIGKTLCIIPGQLTWTRRDVSKLSAVSFEIDHIEGTLSHTIFQP
jgi:Icc-related predicted phosphoesterase